eukprot:CAMPEP_0198276760 /NCGR_PEP_ID=MMETSP1447-20131203/65480_1 /TAXON_ID=420782 /ORGANISM="Chaetoceros dichaeta, Strain CCMP1751" /LENGTH=64 /DNA_ID=CAMNT_0043971723 /DNA_START=1419 /DNA_END=1610 /DNA_ORIENTATION=+
MADELTISQKHMKRMIRWYGGDNLFSERQIIEITNAEDNIEALPEIMAKILAFHVNIIQFGGYG